MSRYDVLAKRTSPKPEIVGAGNTPGSRRGNPSYRQFSAYIPIELYRKLKMRLAENDTDLSQAVEQAISEWIQKEAQ